MIRRPPRSTQSRSSAASDVYKRQVKKQERNGHDSEDEVLQTIDQPLSAHTPPGSINSPSSNHNNNNHSHPSGGHLKSAVDPSSVNGRSLPLLFIRPSDGMGHHSGRSVVCETLIQNLTMNALTNGPGAT